MCNLYTLTKSPEAIRSLFAKLQMPIRFPEGVPNLEPRDICITDRAPIVRAADDGTAFDLLMRRWSWPASHGKPLYNLRSEGRNFPSRRCLALADGFYEYTAQTDPKVKRKHKWRFSMADGGLFAIAGIWRDEPSVGEAFTLLTAEPGEDVSPYHHRQIVILPPNRFGRWLDPAIPSSELLKPLPAGSLQVEQIA